MSVIKTYVSKREYGGLYVFININEINGARDDSNGIKTGIGRCSLSDGLKQPINALSIKTIDKDKNNTLSVQNDDVNGIKEDPAPNTDANVVTTSEDQGENNQLFQDHTRNIGKVGNKILASNATDNVNKSENVKNDVKESHKVNDKINGTTTTEEEIKISTITSNLGDLTVGDYDTDSEKDRDVSLTKMIDVRCGSCLRLRNIVNFCLTCQLPFCSFCFSEHSNQEHDFVLSIFDNCDNIDQVLCPKHEKYKLDMFCLNCETFMCVVCKLLAHVHHAFLDLDSHTITEVTDRSSSHLLNENPKSDRKIFTGIDWNICTVAKRKRICVTLPCC